MKLLLRFAVPLLAAAILTGAGKKPLVDVGFFAEANGQDTTSFAKPVQLMYPTPHEAYIDKIPTISARDIKMIYPFQAKDGSWGCEFLLDQMGRTHLSVLSNDRKGKSLVPVVQGKNMMHQLPDMIIDRPINDGMLPIPSGLTKIEIDALTKQFPIWGEKKK
jgi:hypothetical protein